MQLEESKLLAQINQDFSASDLERLRYLDRKLEAGGLSEPEAAESLQLATAFENYSVHRLQLLIKLADLRKVSLDEVMSQLELKPLDSA